MSKLHAQFYADHLIQTEAAIEQQELIAEETYRLRVSAPEIAAAVTIARLQPGGNHPNAARAGTARLSTCPTWTKR